MSADSERYLQLMQLLEDARCSADFEKISEAESDLFKEFPDRAACGLPH
jgi:hypothetical protein